MRICGFNKTTLLDYPGKVASTIFLGGCNFRCPFCQNSVLVLHPEEQPDYAREDILAFLKNGKGFWTEYVFREESPHWLQTWKNF